jgi:hypothetical protein
VRGQSNDLLSLTQNLETRAKRNFTSPQKLDRDLERAVTHMDQLHMNLPALLAAQDVEIAELREMLSNDAISKSALKGRAQEIQTYRKGLLGSLNASVARATLTSQALLNAQSSGRAELGRQTRTAQDLTRDVKAARTMIEMQL